MDQYQIRELFNSLDFALGLGRKTDDPKRLRASKFQLIRLEKDVCTFQHVDVPEIRVQFSLKTKRIL